MRIDQEVVDDVIRLQQMIGRATMLARRLRINHTLPPYVNDRIDVAMSSLSEAAKQVSYAKGSLTKQRRYR